jgi:hypothetical protein
MSKQIERGKQDEGKAAPQIKAEPATEKAVAMKNVVISVRLAEQPPEAAIVGRVDGAKNLLEAMKSIVELNLKSAEPESREAAHAIGKTVEEKETQLVAEVDGKTVELKDKIGTHASENDVGEGVKALTANIVLAVAQQGGC